MFGIENYFTFLSAGILLNLTPGADTIYILTRSIAHGKRAGIYSVLGIATGTLIHIFFAAVGLSIILNTSAIAFNTVKYLGAGYLVYLGIKMIINKTNPFENAKLSDKTGIKTIYRQAVLTNVLNPKVALFFLSFLPQFISTNNNYGVIPFLILGGTFLTTGTLWCLVLAHSASYITIKLRNNTKSANVMQKISGAVFLGLGVQIAFKK